MIKQTKSFTVDGDSYSYLSSVFKKAKTDVSISMFIDKCLSELSDYLQKIENLLKGSKTYTVPMSYVIKRIIEDKDILGLYKDWPFPQDPEDKVEFMIMGWQEDYETIQRKIPVEFYSYLKSGLYMLSPDKKNLIKKKTGEKYIVVGKSLVPFNEGDKKVVNRKRDKKTYKT